MIVVGIEIVCEALGISEQAVGNHVKAGTVVRIEKGQYDLVTSVRNYIAAQRTHDTPRLTAARVELAREKAAMAKMDRLQRAGELAPIADFEHVATFIMGVVRQRL